MRLTILGATGGIGRALVDQGIAQGHSITAVVRDPARLPVSDDRLDVRVADVFDPAALQPAIKDADAVLSALGPRASSAYSHEINSKGVRSAITAMRAVKVTRLVVVSAAPVLRDPRDPFMVRYAVRPLLWALMRSHYEDLVAMEDAVRGSGLRWTIVRPPRLTDKPATGNYRTVPERNVGTSIPRADVADAMLRALADDGTVGTAIGVGQ